MTDPFGRVEARQLLLAHGKGDDGDIVGADAGGGQFLVKADIGVAIDGRDHAHLLAARAERHDIAHDGRPVGMAKRGVIDENVLGGDTLGFQAGIENGVVVRG
jgi:hypothetical protein